MWDRYSASRRRQGVRRIKYTSLFLVLKHASSPQSASDGGQGKKLGGSWGCSWENHLSVFLLGEREKKNLLEQDKRNERHAESQTWHIWVTFSRTGNMEIFERIRLIGEKETTKEYLSLTSWPLTSVVPAES